MGSQPIAVLSELGLCTRGGVTITPTFYHTPVNINEFGPNIPVELLNDLMLVDVSFTLSHYDLDILNIMMAESVGGAPFTPGPSIRPITGTFNKRGTLLGGGRQMYASGNHLFSVGITWEDFPFTFISCHLNGPQFPVGVETSYPRVSVRCFPYVPLFSGSLNQPTTSGMYFEASSSGVPLWLNDTLE